MSRELTIVELERLGQSKSGARELLARVDRVGRTSPMEAWREISQSVLLPDVSFEVHKRLFESTFADWDPALGPPPAWSPTPETFARSNTVRWMRELECESVPEFYAWSVQNREAFWHRIVQELGIHFVRSYTKVLDLSDGVEKPHWLAGAKYNIVDSCFLAEPEKIAIEYHDESGGGRQVSYGELERLANRVAGGLIAAGFGPGDALVIYLPMTIEAVAIYLGSIRAGCVPVSVADSLAADEVALRMRLSSAKGVFTQESLLRGGKELPLYGKIQEAGAPRAIVIPDRKVVPLRNGDIAWEAFLGDNTEFESYLADPDEATNILFSSGTTGEPKAIPWTHLTPIKCAADSYLHIDVGPDDRLAWPTNLGWMMGPWLIYSALLNRASMALFGGAPAGREFGRFVSEAGVTVLGVIPSLVKTWRATGCLEGIDWTGIRAFSTTGECSNPDDMLYLMSRAGYRPIIELCGGTELGGGYISSTMIEPNVPSTFSTPSFGTGMYLEGLEASEPGTGEVLLVPPAIGMSTRLLHHDHHAVYFAKMPHGPAGEVLRRHGDALQRLPGGYYRAIGRTDDTMNLGGIKVSSVEIERVLNAVPGVKETAAVAVTPPGGGPSLLWVFAVLQDSSQTDATAWTKPLQDAIRRHLNPLFKIDQVRIIGDLPRTASNKVMRRLLRDDATKQLKAGAKAPAPA